MKLKLTVSGFLVLLFMNSSAFGESIHLTQIQSIKELGANNGNMTIEVTYVRHCNDKFSTLVLTEVPPFILSAPNIAVMVLVEDTGIKCMASDAIETQSFQLPNIAGAYQYHLVQPTPGDN